MTVLINFKQNTFEKYLLTKKNDGSLVFAYQRLKIKLNKK